MKSCPSHDGTLQSEVATPAGPLAACKMDFVTTDGPESVWFANVAPFGLLRDEKNSTLKDGVRVVRVQELKFARKGTTTN